uniref:ATP synthase F(0) complex subunit a n=1 Tax=Geospiza parvula TaxID=87175 RepID=A0A8U8CGW0_GEOPR
MWAAGARVRLCLLCCLCVRPRGRGTPRSPREWEFIVCVCVCAVSVCPVFPTVCGSPCAVPRCQRPWLAARGFAVGCEQCPCPSVLLATLITGLRNPPSVSLGHPHPTNPCPNPNRDNKSTYSPISTGCTPNSHTAGHLLIHLMSTATTALFSTIPAVSLLTLLVLFLLTILEVAVAVIQAYVFALLPSLYLQENI